MLSDRSYMRDDDYPRQRTSVLTWLICSIIAGFVLQFVFGSAWFSRAHSLEPNFGVTVSGLRSGHVWTLLTYGFLHSRGNLFHIVGNVLALYFLGRELLPLLGARRFLGLYATALVIGALGWTAVHGPLHDGDLLLGATAGVDALLIVFACFYPNQELNFLLFFVFPVTLKPKHFAIGLVALDLFGLLLYEIPGSALPFAMANSAHLGGMAVGWLYYRFVHNARWRLGTARGDVELPRWMRRSAKSAPAAPDSRVNVGTREGLRAEVDRILDKINSQGCGALTAAEKRRLDEAKDLLSRR
jgi:membrane associated rhomboid family serine protease